ncbi:MAG: RNA degradosome polyphosphate kinase [Eubacteriales bacterium]
MEHKISYKDVKYYNNRELSWLLFNKRVLSEARDKTIPLLERVKFLSITSSNLDEFFMVRVASLKDMVNAHYTKPDMAGLTPKEQLAKLNDATHQLVTQQYSTFNRSLLPLLKNEGIELVQEQDVLTREEQKYLDRYFMDNVYPVLTPMAVDSSRPFPLVRNKTLNIGALIQKKGQEEIDFATVQVPSVLPRLVRIPNKKSGVTKLILLEEVIAHNIHMLFSNYEVVCAHPFRIMRNADLTIEEDEAADLLKEIEKQLKKRQWGEVIRLEVDANMDKRLLTILKKELQIHRDDIYSISGPLDLTFLMKLTGLEGYDHLRNEPYRSQPVPALLPDYSIFETIQKQDVLLHHPYETFQPVIDFIRQAAKDPDVLAIKQTLYRVSGNSPIITALAQAAENGKQVTVLVELKARFDEENNIVWAKKLEQSGCHVIYGLVGLKTHSKITLIVRREDEGIRRYVHLGTGNYNDATAKLYTDMGLLTCDVAIGEDATAVFNMLSGYAEPMSWNKLTIAPIWLKDRFLDLIRRETEHAKNNLPAHIIVKVNSLCDRDVIAALYKANAAGVTIDLIVRGICALKVGIPGISDRITVRSIVGNYLEHSRIFYFENAGRSEVYLSSADWMPRNLERRVEILFPIEDPTLKAQVKEILDIQLRDTVKAHIMQANGSYEKVDKRGREILNSQLYFCEQSMNHASDIAQERKESYNKRVFIPEVNTTEE